MDDQAVVAALADVVNEIVGAVKRIGMVAAACLDVARHHLAAVFHQVKSTAAGGSLPSHRALVGFSPRPEGFPVARSDGAYEQVSQVVGAASRRAEPRPLLYSAAIHSLLAERSSTLLTRPADEELIATSR